MQRTENTGKVARRRVGSSTTLNRKYVKRPTKNMEPTVAMTTERSAKIQRFYNSNSDMAESTMMNQSSVIDTQMVRVRNSRVTTNQSSVTNAQVVAPMAQGLMADTQMVAPAAALDTQNMNVGSQVMGVESRVTSTESQVVSTESQVVGAKPHPLQEVANSRMRARKSTVKKEKKMTAKELKDKAIKEALAAASATGTTSATSKVSKKKKSKSPKMHFGFGRVVLALSCAAVAVFAIVYFVNLNMPDVSLKVAAMQTGINATYPNYVPRDYTLSSITSENKKIVLDFKNAENDGAFTLVEETSSWDSNALLSNYVKDTYGENYQVVKEQGLTLYISGSNAAWVNGGIVYKITTNKGSLTNKQIKAIATSL